MKKVSFAIILLTVCVLVFNVTGAYALNSNDRVSYNWYCNKVINGNPPPLPKEFEFINSYGGYYLDNKAAQSGKKVIYLTFDAGYENGNIEKILDILKDHNVKAAFFVLSNLIKRNTDLVKRMVNEGHLICNHTSSHKDMTKLASKTEFEKELNELNEIMIEYCNTPLAPFYRPPKGQFSAENLKWANELGYKTIFWSCAYDDWDNNRQMNNEKAMDKLISRLHCGEILLLHPTSKTNAEILDDFLTRLENCGYVFGSLYDLD